MNFNISMQGNKRMISPFNAEVNLVDLKEAFNAGAKNSLAKLPPSFLKKLKPSLLEPRSKEKPEKSCMRLGCTMQVSIVR